MAKGVKAIKARLSKLVERWEGICIVTMFLTASLLVVNFIVVAMDVGFIPAIVPREALEGSVFDNWVFRGMCALVIVLALVYGLAYRRYLMYAYALDDFDE